MSTDQPSPVAGESPSDEPRTTPQHATPTETRSTGAARTGTTDPLRGSRTSGIWVAVLALVVVIILLAIFILQNTQETAVSFLGWTGTAPLSATLLIAAAGGALLVAAAGALRILQLRRRVKRDRKGK